MFDQRLVQSGTFGIFCKEDHRIVINELSGETEGFRPIISVDHGRYPFDINSARTLSGLVAYLGSKQP